MKESKIPSMTKDDVGMDKVFDYVLMLAKTTADSYSKNEKLHAEKAISIVAQYYMLQRFK